MGTEVNRNSDFENRTVSFFTFSGLIPTRESLINNKSILNVFWVKSVEVYILFSFFNEKK